MRYRFAREGVDTVIGNHLKYGSLLWEETLPVTWRAGNRLDDVVGTASEIRREDDGWLTAEVMWNAKGREMFEALDSDINTSEPGVWLTIFAHLITEESPQVGAMRVIHQATVKYLFVTLQQEDPWKDKHA